MAKKNIFTQTKKQKAQAFFNENRLNEARELYLQICCTDQSDPDVFAMLGVIMGQFGQMNEAAAYFRKAIALRPDFAEAHYNLGKACKELGQVEEAVSSYEAALRLRPDWAEALYNLGNILNLQGRMREAETCYRRVLAINPEYSKAYKILGNLLISLGDLDEAWDCFQDLEKIDPASVDVKIGEAKIKQRRGEFDQASAIAKRLIESGTKSLEIDFLYASLCRDEDAIARLEPWLANNEQGIENQQRVTLHFMLGDLYDKQGDYQQAFDHYLTANRLKARTYNVEAFSSIIDGLISVFTPEFISTAPRATHKSRRPIFILGMPRSGTTLVEQILDSHPDVFGAGELEDIRLITTELLQVDERGQFTSDCLNDLSVDTCNRLADRYLVHLDELSPDTQYVTDKMPQNFIGLGIISLLFPDARVISCVRDPLDTCMSCFFHDFGTAHAYSYDLEILGKYYREYQRMMRYWRTAVDIPVLDVSYEALVADLEGVTRTLLEFCNLEWSDECLRFYNNKRTVSTLSYDQVRRPIYTSSIGRWKKYESCIKPLIETLRIH